MAFKLRGRLILYEPNTPTYNCSIPKPNRWVGTYYYMSVFENILLTLISMVQTNKRAIVKQQLYRKNKHNFNEV